MFDFAVVGAGIGGSVVSSILNHLGYNVVLFERLDYLCGCAGTFKRKGYYFNAGAATFVGLDGNLPLAKLKHLLNLEFPVKKIDPSLKIYIKDKIINRYQDKDMAFEEIQKAFYDKNNKKFWNTIYTTSDLIWQMLYDFLPQASNLPSTKLILKAFKNIDKIVRIAPNFFKNAKTYALQTLNNLDKDYERFLSYHTLITAQGFLDEVNVGVASLGLTYPNLDNYYVLGGMDKACEVFVKNLKHVFRKTTVKKIKHYEDKFVLETTAGEFEAKNVILNKTIFDMFELFDDPYIKEFSFKSQKTFTKKWGAFTMYFMVDDIFGDDFEYHHFILLDEEIPFTKSKSIFLSISAKEDTLLSIENKRSITISTHSEIDSWFDVDKDEYKRRKKLVEEFILKKLYEYIPIFKNAKLYNVESGTPLTFRRYTSRYMGAVGGIPVINKYFFNYPRPITPKKGVYVVGDTVFPGQGWPGVSLGAINLAQLIDKNFKI